jgi:hypothetical protein
MQYPEQRVRFLWPPQMGRPMTPDEQFLVERFSKHTSVCYHCHDFIRSKRTYTLCHEGYRFLEGVTAKMYPRDGKVFSTIRDHKCGRIQIEIPPQSTEIFMAIEMAERQRVAGPQPSPAGGRNQSRKQPRRFTEQTVTTRSDKSTTISFISFKSTTISFKSRTKERKLY